MFSVSIRKDEHPEAFHWTLGFLAALVPNSHKVSVAMPSPADQSRKMLTLSDGHKTPSQMQFVLAVGKHQMSLNSVPIEFERFEQGDSTGGKKSKMEQLVLRVSLEHKSVLENLLLQAEQDHNERLRSVIKIFSAVGWTWAPMATKPRTCQAALARTAVMEEVLADARRWKESKEAYQSLGIPWRRGYLFYGMPGCGKSATVLLLASELGMNVFMLKLSGLTDESLEGLLQQVPPGNLVLLEDVDTSGSCVLDRNLPAEDRAAAAGENGGVTMTGLLNLMDGLPAGEGRIIILTTNYRDRLDQALLREGRVDAHFMFGPSTAAEGACLFDKIVGPGFRGAEARQAAFNRVKEKLEELHRAVDRLRVDYPQATINYPAAAALHGMSLSTARITPGHGDPVATFLRRLDDWLAKQRAAAETNKGPSE